MAVAAKERLEHRGSRFPHLLLRALLLDVHLQLALVLELSLPTASRRQGVLPPLGLDRIELVGRKVLRAQLVFLALGFLGPEADVIKTLGLKQDARSNIQTPPKSYHTSVEGVFAAGDCRRGQSLIVWGIK